MPTLIDEMVIKLSFDMEGLKKRGAETEEQLKKIREGAEKTGKDMENSGKRASQFFASAKVEALALMSVLTGGAGLITAAAATASSIAELGRAATNLNGMNPQALDAWGMALKRIGGNAEDAITSFNNVGAALARYKLKGDTAIIPYLNAIGAQSTMTPEQIAIKFSEYIKAHPEKTAQEVNVIGQGLGMTQSMTNLLRTGPDNVAKELELSRTLGLRTQEMIDTASKFQHDFEALNQAARHLTDRFMTKMMPTIDAFVVGLTKWITENPDTATAAAAGGAAISGAAGTSAIARMLGLTGLADAFGTLTAAMLKFAGILGLISLTGAAGGQATQEETDATTERLRKEGKLAPGSGTPLPAGYQDPNKGPSIWGWVKTKLGFGDEATPTGNPVSTSAVGPRAGAFGGPRADAAGQASLAFWKSKGLSDAAAAGMAAQEVAESGGNPAARGDYVNGNPTAHGAYQWHADRRAAMLAATGIDVSTASIEQQREAAFWEYTHSERRTREQMASATDAAHAGKIGVGFERPGDRIGEEAKRSQIAARIDRLSRGNNNPPTLPNAQAGPRATLVPDPNLLPPPGGRGEALPLLQQHSSTSMDVGHITIHTAANDANGIAKEIHGALSDKMIAQANRGLV